MITYTILAIFFVLWYYFTRKPSVPIGLKPLPSPSGARFYFGNFFYKICILKKYALIFIQNIGHYGLLGAKPHET